MAFEIQRTSATLSGRSSAVRSNIDVRTGSTGQAVAQAGSVLMTLGEKWDLQEADTQFTQAKSQARAEHNSFLLSLEGMEPAEYGKAYDSSIKRRQTFMPRNPRGAREYKKWLTTLDPFWVDDKNKFMKAKLNDNGRAVGFIAQQEAVETGRMDEYLIHLAKGTKLGYYSKEEAVKLRQKTLDDREQYVAKRKREAAAAKKLAQEKTNATMLADFWDGKITSVQTIEDAVRNELISAANGKYLRDAFLNPDPPKHILTAEAQVLQAIEDIGTNAGDKQDALDTLTANVQNLDPEKASSLLKSIFSAKDKNISEMMRESRDLMEELVRDRDELTGLFTDDERQILGAAEAYLMLDAEVQKAAGEKKPLSRRDVMIKAISIGRQMKKKIKAEEEVGEEPSFEPDEELPLPPDEFKLSVLPKMSKKEVQASIERAEKTRREKVKKLPVPAFVMDGKEPEMVFDSEGKELGLKLKRGGIWRIGESGYINGRIYEYTGNGNWKAVK
jgi:hypothetical protein